MTDSMNKDEARDRRREEALARRVGEALDQLAQRDTVDCPDAELIAAYHEKSLAADEIARWENHFATCARCRKVLQVLAASVDAPLDEREVARLGKMVAAARSPLEARTPSDGQFHPARLNWRRRWLAPALGIAAVLAVWFAMRPPWRTAEQNSTGTLVAQAPRSEPAPGMQAETKQQSAEPTVTPRENARTDAEAKGNREAQTTQSRSARADSLAKKKTDAGSVAREIAPSSNAAENNLRDEKQKTESNIYQATGPIAGLKAPAPAARAAAAPAAPTAAPLPPPPPVPAPEAQDKVQVTAQAPPIELPPPSTKQRVEVTQATPQVDTTSSAISGSLSESNVKDLPLNGRSYTSLAKLKAGVEIPVQINSPSGKIVWRAGNGGFIQRSADGGRTWSAQARPLRQDWLTGVAVSDTVCWIVGRNGAIALTTDGSHWKTIAPPVMAADSSGKLPDWSGVTASDAKTATITSSDQRHFATQDAGKSWNAQ